MSEKNKLFFTVGDEMVFSKPVNQYFVCIFTLDIRCCVVMFHWNALSGCLHKANSHNLSIDLAKFGHRTRSTVGPDFEHHYKFEKQALSSYNAILLLSLLATSGSKWLRPESLLYIYHGPYEIWRWRPWACGHKTMQILHNDNNPCCYQPIWLHKCIRA